MFVIGTAGHVDHGKSTLVEALTGIHPDRLKEERERQMTIDLGFAWLTLPDGEEIGIVDVPGHRDFIENMLAGVGGIDAALFVVAADEGVMPQTREHLAILNLLQIQGGVIALTKSDLVDQDWLELVQEDLHLTLLGSVLENALIIPVSAKTGQGLKELLAAITACLADRQPRADLGRPRLPIDRVFTIAGFGTVITGTLSDGCLRVGEEIEILPRGVKGRIRGLQTHKNKEDIAKAGSRTAVNIGGVALDQVRRGDILVHPGNYKPSRRIDVRFQMLLEASQPLKHSTEVKLFIGAKEVIARVRLLGIDELANGATGWLQLELSEPIVSVRGDRFILRRPSPSETLGGGSVVDPHPKGRHKRFSEAILIGLEALAQGTPSDIMLEAFNAIGAAPLKEIILHSNLEAALAFQTASELTSQGLIVRLEKHSDELDEGWIDPLKINLDPGEWVVSRALWERSASRVFTEVNSYHRLNPLRPGIPREELKSRIKAEALFSPKYLNLLLDRLVNLGALKENGPLISTADFQIELTPQQKQNVDRMLARFSQTPYSPPSIKECQAEIGEELFQVLIYKNVLKTVSQDVVFRVKDYQEMISQVRILIQRNGSITAAQVRDHFNTSRKYALALLEHLDTIGITIRDGDARRLPD